MTTENTQTDPDPAEGDGPAQEPLEPPPAEGDGKGNQTRYMVLMANVTAKLDEVAEGEGERLEHDGYRELGWHTAWSPSIAKEAALAAALEAADAGGTPENGKSELQAQLESLGVLLRAIPQRSWAEVVEPSDVYVPPAELRVR